MAKKKSSVLVMTTLLGGLPLLVVTLALMPNSFLDGGNETFGVLLALAPAVVSSGILLAAFAMMGLEMLFVPNFQKKYSYFLTHSPAFFLFGFSVFISGAIYSFASTAPLHRVVVGENVKGFFSFVYELPKQNTVNPNLEYHINKPGIFDVGLVRLARNIQIPSEKAEAKTPVGGNLIFVDTKGSRIHKNCLSCDWRPRELAPDEETCGVGGACSPPEGQTFQIACYLDCESPRDISSIPNAEIEDAIKSLPSLALQSVEIIK